MIDISTLKPGDKIEFIDGTGEIDPPFEKGDVVTVSQTGGYALGGWVTIKEDPTGDGWGASWFQPVTEKPEPRLLVKPEREGDVLVLNVSPYHLRGYDFNQGDQRSFSAEEALACAQRRVRDRGCRQQVRRVRLEDGDHLTPNWLIQDI